MKSAERQQEIISIIPYNGYIMVKDLSARFDVTEETIRRDLQSICERCSTIKKVHGGVYRTTDDDLATPQTFRNVLLTAEKTRFGEYSTSLLASGETVMLDSSTTSTYIAKAIKEKKLKLLIITNSIQIAEVFQDDEDVNVVIVGGKLRKTNGSLIGSHAIDMITRYCADYCFISPSSIDKEYGLTDNSEEEALVRECMIKNSKKRILVADNTKFGRANPHKIASIDIFDRVVTDKATSDDWINFITEMNIPVTCC